MSDVDAVSSLDETIHSVILSNLTSNVTLIENNQKIEETNLLNNNNNISCNDIISDTISINTSKSEHVTTVDVVSKIRELNHPVQCYVNDDNTISFLKNTNSCQNKNGEIFYACLTSAANISQDDQILQLIPQNKLANYIVSHKEYSAVQFLNAPPKLDTNQFINSELTDDIPISTKITNQKCSVCNKEFPSKRSYLKHMTIHDNDREFKCRWCKVSYNHDVNLLVHVAIIHPNQCAVDSDADMNYNCLVCMLKFSRTKALQGHCLIHQVDEELYCDLCSASFNSRILLEKHISGHSKRTHTVTEKGALHCRICKMIFQSVGHIKRHYKQFHPRETNLSEVLKDNEQSELESDQNIDPDDKNRRRSSKVAVNIIKRYAQNEENVVDDSDESFHEAPKRGRPRKVDTDKSPMNIKKEMVTESRRQSKTKKVDELPVTEQESNETKETVSDGGKFSSAARELASIGVRKRSQLKTIGSVMKNKKLRDVTKALIAEVRRLNARNEIDGAVTVGKSNVPRVGTNELRKRGRPKRVVLDTAVLEDTLEVIDDPAMVDEPQEPKMSLDHSVDFELSLELSDNAAAEIKRRGRPRGSLNKDKSRGLSEESTGEVRKRGRPRGTGNSQLSEHRCGRCGRLFKTAMLLRRHEVTHTGLKEFECHICQKKFTQKSSVKIHMAIHSETKSYECQYCHKSFTYEHNMHTHVKNVHRDGRPQSGRSLSLSRVLGAAGHRMMTSLGVCGGSSQVVVQPEVVIKKRWVRCRLCKAAKRRTCTLCRHVRPRTGPVRPHKCQHCYRSFQSEFVLDSHLSSHSWPKAGYSCEECSKTFFLAQTLLVHQRLHRGRPIRYKCNRCPKKFASANKYRLHCTTAHPPPPVPAEVDDDRDEIIELETRDGVPAVPLAGGHSYRHRQQPQLSDSLPTKTYILQERSVVKVVRPFQCHQCDKSYKLRRYLRDHLKDHKSYSDRHGCKYCVKTFLTVRSLQQHTRTMHVKRRVFACSLCPATFILKASLIRHGVVHTDLKPYACPMCLRTFKTQLYCDRHINQQKCVRPSAAGAGLETDHKGEPMTQDEGGGSAVPYCNYRLVDADINVSEAQNMFMTSFVNEYTGDKFMVVNLDKENQDQGNQLRQPWLAGPDEPANQEVYYRNQLLQVQCGPTGVSTLLDKYPLLSASLFTNDQDQDYITDPCLWVSNGGPGPTTATTSNGLTSSYDLLADSLAGHQSSQGTFYHQCTNCSRLFPDSDSLSSHVKESHPVDKTFVCHICNKAFSVELSLWAHSKIHKGHLDPGTELQCRACQQSFRSVPSLSRHVRMQHNDTLNYYKCAHCHQTYKTTRELDSHIKMINADYDALLIDGPHSGQAASATGTSHDYGGGVNHREAYKKLPRQIRNPNLSKDFSLELKDSEIDQIASLDMNRATKLSMQELIKAARHRRDVSKPGRGRPGRRRRRLSAGGNSHSDQYEDGAPAPYSCAVCHKGFSRSSNLHQHLSVHTKLTPYECTKCDRKFRHRCSLKTHENTKHSNLIKLLRCHLCQRLLRSQVALGNHMRMHLKTYPARCDKCSMMLDNYDQEKRHRKSTHPSSKIPKTRRLVADGDDNDADPSTVVAEIELSGLVDGTTVLEQVSPAEERGPTEFEKSTIPDSVMTEQAMVARKIMESPFAPKIILPTKISVPPMVITSTPKPAKVARKPAAPRSRQKKVVAKERSASPPQVPPPPVKVVKEGPVPTIPVVVSVIKCVVCEVKYSNLIDYENHQCRKEKWKSHQCALCDDTFTTSTELHSHISNQHKQQSHFSCSLCNLLFINRTLLVTHQKTVHRL